MRFSTMTTRFERRRWAITRTRRKAIALVFTWFLLTWLWARTLTTTSSDSTIIGKDVDDIAVNDSEPVSSLDGIYELIKRRVHEDDVSRIHLEFRRPIKTGEESFEWQVIKTETSDRTSAHLRGTSLSSLTKGLGDLFEKHCMVSLVSWADWSRPSKPCFVVKQSELPLEGHLISRFRYRYGWNAVTFSYSTTYWNWTRYERELDWLALRGVNLLLAHEGQEYLLDKTLRNYVGDDCINHFFTHQTYLAWNRMGNIHSLAGPPDREYLKERFELQLQILSRMKQLGIQPVLPGSNGFVPRSFPSAICEPKLWSGFSKSTSSVCRPKDILKLHKLIQSFAETQLIEYKHVLNAHQPVHFSSDMFNENPVGESAQATLTELGRTVVKAHRDAARLHGFLYGAKIVMQMWFFANDFYYWTPSRARQFLDTFPSASLVLLDLHAEKRSQAVRLGLNENWLKRTGHDIIFCVLHNFGGGGGMAGEVGLTLRKVNSLQSRYSGIGFAPEALEQNEIVYESLLGEAFIEQIVPAASKPEVRLRSFERFLSTGKGLGNFNVVSWIRGRYRWNGPVENLERAWYMLLNTAYARPSSLSGFGPTKSVWEIRPVPGLMIRGEFMPTLLSYPCRTFGDALDLLLSMELHSSAFLFDIVDIGRQALADLALELAIKLQQAHFGDDENTFSALKNEMLTTLDLTGRMLGAHPLFCFEDVSAQPALHADAMVSARQLWRQIVTVWHKDNNGLLMDYASRQRGGTLFHHVHRKRWEYLLTDMHVFGSYTTRLEQEFDRIEQEWYKGAHFGDENNKCSKEVSPMQIRSVATEVLLHVRGSKICSGIKIKNSIEKERVVPVFGGSSREEAEGEISEWDDDDDEDGREDLEDDSQISFA